MALDSIGWPVMEESNSPRSPSDAGNKTPNSLRGILKSKTPTEPHGDKHLKWDEAKLEETEAGKNATMKITEPKTPFAYSVADVSEEEGNGMPRLQLNGSDNESLGSSSFPTSEGADWESSAEDADLSHLTEEERALHHAKFEKMRKEHYRMREALKKGRELVKSESEFSDEEEEDD